MNRKRMVKRWKFSWMDHAGRDKDGILWVRYGVGGWQIPLTNITAILESEPQ
jgi:hypothetical protein